MSIDAPGTEKILPLARRALLDRVAPLLEGEAKLDALMAAKAIELLLRESEVAAHARYTIDHALFGKTPPDRAAAMGALAQAIRAGAHDADDDLRAGLIAAAQARLKLWNPKLVETLSAPDALDVE